MSAQPSDYIFEYPKRLAAAWWLAAGRDAMRCAASVGQNYAWAFFQQNAEFRNAQHGRHVAAGGGSIKVLKFHFLDSVRVKAAWL